MAAFRNTVASLNEPPSVAEVGSLSVAQSPAAGTVWREIGPQEIAGYRQPATSERELKSFIGGLQEASWQIACDDRILPLSVVGKVLDSLVDRDPGSEIRVIMLGGGCGEGKTTALRQIGVRWQQQSKSTRRLLIREGSAGQAQDFLTRLASSEAEGDAEPRMWLVMIDNARDIASIFGLAESLFQAGRHNVHIVFACSHIAWPRDQRLPPQAPLQAKVDFIVHHLTGLAWKDDSAAIVDSWVNAGIIGPDDRDTTRTRLFDLARGGAIPFTDDGGNSVEGSLLGALLREWKPSGAKLRIGRIIKRLADEHSESDGRIPLLYALGATAAAHANGFPGFSRRFLLRCLHLSGQCTRLADAEGIVDRLLYEAVVVETDEDRLATRHAAIAEFLASECAAKLEMKRKTDFLENLITFALDTTDLPDHPLYDGPRRPLMEAAARYYLEVQSFHAAAHYCLLCLSDAPVPAPGAAGVRAHDDAPLTRDLALAALSVLCRVVPKILGRAAADAARDLDLWTGALERQEPPFGRYPDDRAFGQQMVAIIHTLLTSRRLGVITPEGCRTTSSRPQEHRFSTLYTLIFHPRPLGAPGPGPFLYRSP